jgi:hypothetical protein
MKKTYLYLSLVFVLLVMFSCGSGGDEPDDIKVDENTAPTVPNQVFPLNNTVCTDHNVLFEWNASSDTEGNTVTYRVEIAENSSFSPLLYSESSFSESRLISLSEGKAYYWRIKAIDSRNAESAYSPTMQFLTEGEGVSNHIPFAPALLSPVLNSEVSGTTVNISWSASDVDGDPLAFDVYLDTKENPATKVSENQTETTYEAANLAPATKYYFKVVVKDDKGAISVGQVWSFTTK